MTTITHDTNDDSNDDGTAAGTARAARELRALTAARNGVFATRAATDADWAVRCSVLALSHAREAGWWRVLVRVSAHDFDVPQVYVTAAVIAEGHARDQAKYWRECAGEWRARAERRPTSDAAGALSNWAELGVTA